MDMHILLLNISLYSANVRETYSSLWNTIEQNTVQQRGGSEQSLKKLQAFYAIPACAAVVQNKGHNI
jgi:hypothetical protein